MVIERPIYAGPIQGRPTPSPAATLPLVTVAVPCLNEESHIDECLKGILQQDYPREKIEILVADGMSTDGTRAILARLANAWPQIVVIDNPGRIQSTALNAILQRARGEIVVRMDVHCDYAPDYIRRCVEELERTGADNVGGAQRTRAKTPFQAALCAALGSPLGMGLARHRSPDAEGYVQTVFLGAFRRSLFDKIGLYDPNAVTNEDAELNQRILESGGKIYLSRAIVVHYYPRPSLRSLARQYFHYGQGRARTFLKHGGLPTIRPMLPFLWVVTNLLLAAVPPLWALLPWALLSYGSVVLLETFRAGGALGPLGRLRMAAIFPVMHAAHGVGFGTGLVVYGLRPNWGARSVVDAGPTAAPGPSAP